METAKERLNTVVLNIVIAFFMVLMTTVIHAGGMLLAMRAVHLEKQRLEQSLGRIRFYLVCGIVLLMFFVSMLEVSIWAAAYLVLNAVQGFDQAFYFSMVTFTTVGYGDIVLDERWRILASFEAANGIVMFGWSTAIIIQTVQRVFYRKFPFE